MIQCLLPTGHAETPLVTFYQTGKIKMRSRRGKVITSRPGKLQKLTRNLDANCVQTMIMGAGSAHTIAVKSSHRVRTT